MARKNKDLSFEEAMARLDELTQALEHGELPLEEALAYFKEGSALLAHCQKLLGAAEDTLKVLELKDTGGKEEEEEEA
ncbi:exodeoxyribonuclease VII small subunit [Gelria sp. Kuro-4]|uniref:exodeoxyribonuclease VII small subunit n=1 Tax=Gelria sp. Kuro-4 TaxID=2796927 RepID=UPI001BEE85E5|nr:exodeoxyribonuclease VII small subunit [Gelria sp. Kuro-4]BCV25118.1 hypothetical protein kuro4_18910 [Gelria sp. Kuro-4]